MKKNNNKNPDKLNVLNIDYFKYKTKLTRKFEGRKFYKAKDPKMVLAFIPGTIRKINVNEGDKVKQGDLLLILEAMKMKNRILASIDGIVKKITVTSGNIVAKDTILIELQPFEQPKES